MLDLAESSKGLYMIIDTFTKHDFLHKNLFSKLRNITIAEIKSIIYLLEDILIEDDLLVRITKKDLIVIGDTHGDVPVVLSIAKLLFDDNSDYHAIFLGDYVDRGKHQVDVINLVLLLKLNFPDKITLLRGNHEIPTINQRYGFGEHLSSQFGETDGKILWHLYNRLFKHLPLAAITNGRVFLVHGGIPCGLTAIEKIKALPREFNPDNDIILQLLWNDPKESKKCPEYLDNKRGGASKYFGKEAFNKFIEDNNISLVIRSHEELFQGYKYYFNDRLLSIYSARKILDSPFEKQVKPKVVRITRDGILSIEDLNLSGFST